MMNLKIEKMHKLMIFCSYSDITTSYVLITKDNKKTICKVSIECSYDKNDKKIYHIESVQARKTALTDEEKNYIAYYVISNFLQYEEITEDDMIELEKHIKLIIRD